MKTSNFALCLIAAMIVIFAGIAVKAEPPGFTDGVREYQSQHYSAALAAFSKALQIAPSDPLIHYYLGLCYQGLNQMSLAKQQYQWVASTCRDPRLREQAYTAWANLSKYESSWSSPGSRKVASALASAGSASSGQRINGPLKLIEFYTDW